ncbi:MAG: PaaI family thioesterase [Candidatus Binatia bacterium]
MDFPDFWRAFGLRIASSGDDETLMEMDVPEWGMSPFGAVHGGAVAMLLDTALAVAIAQRLSSPEDRIATHQLSISYAAFTGERRLECRARVVSLTRTVAVAEGEVSDGSGKLVAKALGTFGVRRRES